MTKLSQIFILFVLSFFHLTAYSLETLNLPGRRILSYETSNLNQPGPVFIFLPGIYRGYLSSETFVERMKERGVPFVLMHFAEHPDSVAETGTSEPLFSNITASTLAEETAFLVRHLKIGFPIPVTLSYSSVVTAHLDKDLFPFVVETAPIGKDTDGLSPQVAAGYEYWRAMMKTIPFYGEFWFRQMKTLELRKHWGPWVERYADRLPILKEARYRERAIQGYLALSFASDGFDLRKQDFAQGPRRFYILGEKENPSRLSIQKEAIQAYEQATGFNGDVVVVPGAGHNVPVDQPTAYVDLLGQIRKVLIR